MRKKAPIVVALCLASFAGFSGGLGGQLIPAPQAKLYGVTISQMAYQVRWCSVYYQVSSGISSIKEQY